MKRNNLLAAFALTAALSAPGIHASDPYKDALYAGWNSIEDTEYRNRPSGSEFRFSYPDDSLIPELIRLCQNSDAHNDDPLEHGDLVAQQNVAVHVAAKRPDWFARFMWDWKWSWWFGDQKLVWLSRTDDSDQWHVYRQLGTYKAFVISWDLVDQFADSFNAWGSQRVTQNGDSFHIRASSCNYFNVKVVPNNAPVAEARASNYFPSNHETVEFYGGNSYDPDGNRLTYTWTFNDGMVLKGKTVRRSFYNNSLWTRAYKATLAVSDGDKSDAASISISVPSIQMDCGNFECR